MKKTMLIAVVAAGLISGIAAGIALRNKPEHQPLILSSATRFSQPRALPVFSLAVFNQSEFTGESLKGNWTLVFFGFTNCPDVCPTTLATLDRLIEIMKPVENIKTPSVLFISVDPMRDTPEKIRDYVQFFNPNFIGATADTLTLQSLTRAMSVAYMYRPTEDANNYTVDHTSAVLLVDPDARLHAIFSTPHKAADMATDLRKIIDAYN